MGPKAKQQEKSQVEVYAVDSNERFPDEFQDKMVRKNFVSKVYAILSINLLFSAVVVTGLHLDESVREFLYDYWWISIIFGIWGLIFYLILACVESARKSYPCNFILLACMTIGYTGLAATLAAKYEAKIVFVAMLATAGITVTMSLVAKFAPCDVTGCGFFLCIAFIVVMIMSLVVTIVSIFMVTNLLHLILSCILVLLLSFYLVFITQLIMGGKRGELSPDETVLAVIILYVTIIEIFMHLLVIVNACFSGD